MKRRVFLLGISGLIFALFSTIAFTLGTVVFDYYSISNGLEKEQVSFRVDSEKQLCFDDLTKYLSDRLDAFVIISEDFKKTSIYRHNMDLGPCVIKGRNITEEDCINSNAVCIVIEGFNSGNDQEYNGQQIIGQYKDVGNKIHPMPFIMFPLPLDGELNGNIYVASDIKKEELKKIISGFDTGVRFDDMSLMDRIKDVVGFYSLPIEVVELVIVFVLLSLVYVTRTWLKQYTKELNIRWMCGASTFRIYLRIFAEKGIVDAILILACLCVLLMNSYSKLLAFAILAGWVILNFLVLIICLMELSNGFKYYKKQ